MIEYCNRANPESLVSHEDYYKELVVSSSVFFDPHAVECFRNSNILVAGLGSIGNPIAMMAVRSGSENLVIMDPGDIEVSNFQRQQYSVNQCGKNKAYSTRENILSINPYCNVEALSEGLTYENVAEYVDNADIVVDGIDIRSLDLIYELHKKACELRKPVLVGYDLAGTAMLAVYRYDKENKLPLNGELNEQKIQQFKEVKEKYEIGKVTESDFLNYVYSAFAGPINPIQVPVEQLREIINRSPSETRTYQIGTTATVLSGLAVEAMRRILAGEDIKDVIIVDIPSCVRKSSFNPNIIEKIPLLVRALFALKRRERGVSNILENL